MKNIKKIISGALLSATLLGSGLMTSSMACLPTENTSSINNTQNSEFKSTVNQAKVQKAEGLRDEDPAKLSSAKEGFITAFSMVDNNNVLKIRLYDQASQCKGLSRVVEELKKNQNISIERMTEIIEGTSAPTLPENTTKQSSPKNVQPSPLMPNSSQQQTEAFENKLNGDQPQLALSPNTSFAFMNQSSDSQTTSTPSLPQQQMEMSKTKQSSSSQSSSMSLSPDNSNNTMNNLSGNPVTTAENENSPLLGNTTSADSQKTKKPHFSLFNCCMGNK